MQESIILGLKRASTCFPDKVALIDCDKTFTYAEFRDRVYQLANGLAALGIKQGDPVACLCVNHHRYMEMYYATAVMGAIIVPLNLRLAAPELIYILNDSASKLLFIDQPFMPMLPDIRAGATSVEHWVYSDFEQCPEDMKPYEDLLDGRPTTYDIPAIDENDVAGYFYTGGTTGDPKGVMLTIRNIVSNALHIQAVMHYKPEDIYLHAAPMFHLADAASIYAVTMMGGAHVFGRMFDPGLTLELIQKHKVTMTILVPTMVNFVLAHPKFEDYDLSSLRTFLYGASPMPVPLLKKAMKMLPCAPVQGYGMTEGAPLVSGLTAEDHIRGLADPEWAWLLGTAGQPIPGVAVKIVDAEGNEVAIGEAGEIACSGPNFMKGYLNKPEATAEAIRDGWYYSGDIAIRNKHGYFTIVDRMKDMIISGGENIYTTEVENVLMQFPGVLETTVIGVPSEKWGEVVKAFVVMNEGESSGDIEIIEFCRERLAHFKCPQSVEFMESLPKSGAGKILKRSLREAYWGEGKQVN